MEPILDCRALEVRYGSVTAVRDVSFQAYRGQIFGLLGPNGAGKTSVIRALTTIIRPSSGTATVAGHPLGDATAVRRAIGVLPESNGYPNALSAVSYLRYHGQLFDLSRREAEQRARELLDVFGLGGLRRPIGTYSRGMRQRLGLSRALVNRPSVLFLDEPTLGLDPAGKEEVLALLRRHATDDGMCVVLCSHLLDEVERVCDEVGIMHQGQILTTGTVPAVIDTARSVDPTSPARLSEAFLTLTRDRSPSPREPQEVRS